MSEQIAILCVEDEAEVRDALLRDLEPFRERFRIEAVEDVAEAREVVREIEEAGGKLGLVLCDHLLPGTLGVVFLVELQADPKTLHTRKVLVTGQAGLEDTIMAVNSARLDHYVAKPWTAEDLQAVVRAQLTEYVLQEAEDLLPYVSVLDGARLMEAVKHRRTDR